MSVIGYTSTKRFNGFLNCQKGCYNFHQANLTAPIRFLAGVGKDNVNGGGCSF
jgi:hypothetical protein